MKFKNTKIFLSIVLFVIAMSCDENGQKIKYPNTYKSEVRDTFFNIIVEDPYRWLERSDTDAVKNWVEAQNELSFSFLNNLTGRDAIQDQLSKNWNYERISAPFMVGPYLFFYKNEGLDDHSSLYVQEGLEGQAELLLNPADLSEDGTVSISSESASPDGKYLALSISKAGSDWREILIMDVEKKEFLKDHIQHVKFSSISWHSNLGIYYSRYDDPAYKEDPSSPDRFHKVYFHTLGEKQEQNKLIFSDDKKPFRNFYAWVDQSNDFMIMYASDAGSRNHLLWYKDLTVKNSTFQPLIDSFYSRFSVAGKIDDHLIVYTNYKAPQNRLILINPSDPAEEKWKELIPEKEFLIENVTVAGDYIVLRCMENVNSKVLVYDLNGNFVNEIQLPANGTVWNFNGKADQSKAFYTFTSFNYPTTIFSYDLNSHTSDVFFKPQLSFDPDSYEVKQIFYTSNDGTEIPMFIVHRKGLEKNGELPVLIHGYGGFNVSMRPSFSISRMFFIEQGGVYAIPALRGGGEFGGAWHEAGTKLNKQNTFDDFISAAEFLIKEGYTNPSKIAISGRSNGGLLVGAAMTQRPDLFRVALPSVGVMDMLRYHQFTIGWAWISDYGSVEDSAEFINLYNFSPLHNLKENTCYPSTLIMTADHDNRVVPAHSYKFAARLQAVQSCDHPVILRVDTKTGHGSGTPISQIIAQEADVWAFVFSELFKN